MLDAHAANDPFRIAVIDMQMPGMDGESLGRAVKADQRLAGIRMLMLTSVGTRGDAPRFQEIGFAAYVTKPIRHHELEAVLSLALTNRDGTSPATIVTRHTAREMQIAFVGRTARVLLAEDNMTNQHVALAIMKKLGVYADAVANGAEALKSLETIPYDLVVMDVQMPEMDGLEATRHIRDPKSAVQNHLIPIIAMTAGAMRADRDRCLAVGMNDFLTKPIDPQAFAKALERWLPSTTAACDSPRLDATSSQAAAGDSSLHATADGPSVVFDRAAVLGRLMDDEALVKTILDAFLHDIPRQIESLGAYLEQRDLTGAARVAHTIKGAAANVSAEAVRAVAVEMESAAKAGDLRTVTDRMADLEAQFERLKQAIVG